MFLSIFHIFILDAVTTTTKVAVFDSGLLITVALIVFSTLLIAFIQHMKKDKCISSFKSDIITIYFIDGKKAKGRLDVENTGVELILDTPVDVLKRSHIVYKDEYSNIRFFVRYHEDLDEKRQRERNRVLKKTYHPNLFKRIGRKINIFFKIIRDSMMDIFTALSGRMKTTSTSYANSEKYVAKVNSEAVSSLDTSYNPLLEKYIGNMVVCVHTHNEKNHNMVGILKDYTGQYIELLDVEFETDDLKISHADLVLPRSFNKVRSLGEDSVKSFSLPKTFNLSLYKKKVKKSSHDKNPKSVINTD